MEKFLCYSIRIPREVVEVGVVEWRVVEVVEWRVGRPTTSRCATSALGKRPRATRSSINPPNGVGAQRACWRAKMVFSEALR